MSNRSGRSEIPSPLRPPLRLIRGGSRRKIRRGALRLVAAPAPPFAVEAVVEEEDTYLVLSAPPEVRDEPEHPIRLMTELLEARGEEPGSVVVRPGPPLRLLAVVHDLSAEPTWREEWVASALNNVFRVARRRRLRSLALPFLARRHGKLEPERFVALLRGALERGVPENLQRLWLIVP